MMLEAASCEINFEVVAFEGVAFFLFLVAPFEPAAHHRHRRPVSAMEQN